MEAKLPMPVLQGRRQLMGPIDPATINDQHDLFRGFAKGRHPLMEILVQLLGITMRHDFREDFGGAILDGVNDVEQHPTGEPAPRAILPPGVPFATLVTFGLAWTQGPGRQARTLGFAPPFPRGKAKRQTTVSSS